MTGIYFERGFERLFGTWPLTGETCRRAVADALEVGYRSIDTAAAYGNEAEVGQALAASGLPRDAFCLTTKVQPDDFAEDRFFAAVEQSLERLRVDHVDVLLLHWPPIGGDVRPSLELLAEAKRRGHAGAVGVSNYTALMMRLATEVLAPPIAVNQVEFHPLLNQDVLLQAAAETGIPLAAYAALARGKVLDVPILQEIAARYGKTPGQITLRWILQKGVAVTTMSTKPANMRANFDIMDFTLSSVDMARIDALRTTGLRIVDAPRVPWAPAWD